MENKRRQNVTEEKWRMYLILERLIKFQYFVFSGMCNETVMFYQLSRWRDNYIVYFFRRSQPRVSRG